MSTVGTLPADDRARAADRGARPRVQSVGRDLTAPLDHEAAGNPDGAVMFEAAP